MYVCILDQADDIVVHKNLRADPKLFLQTIKPYREGLVVSGRSKPATSGRLKTSHFEEVRIRLVAWTTAPALWEANHGEPAQNGIDRNDFHPSPAWLVATANSP
jgi:hypothetical protein